MPDVKIDIKNLRAVSMEVGGVLLRREGQGNEGETVHLSINETIVLHEWLGGYLEKNRKFAGNTEIEARAVNRSVRSKKAGIAYDSES